MIEYEDLPQDVQDEVEAVTEQMDKLRVQGVKAMRQYDLAADGTVEKARATDWLQQISQLRRTCEAKIDDLLEPHGL